ncbi:MAG: hypothetical protein JW718_02005 [Desulfovibrionaceae bacterium]|nr:hypothetical protein [Desulfovibrionaceae bacterium]
MPNKIIVALELALALPLLAPAAPLRAESPAPAQSQCVQCHTQLKPLIRLTWEVEKIRPKLKSAETAGEG